jgi:hypothetical protein
MVKGGSGGSENGDSGVSDAGSSGEDEGSDGFEKGVMNVPVSPVASFSVMFDCALSAEPGASSCSRAAWPVGGSPGSRPEPRVLVGPCGVGADSTCDAA